jgi:hypothetical protein
MSTRSLVVVVMFSFACGFSSIGVTYGENGAGSAQKNDVTTAETKAAVAKEKAEAAREAAEQAEKEAVAAQGKAAHEK